MLKSILKSVFVLLIYFILKLLFEKLSLYILIRDKFLDLNEIYFYIVETILVFIFISISLIFINKTFKIDEKRKQIFNYKWLILVIILAITFRLIEDPVLRKSIILGKSKIPENINYIKNSNLTLVVIFLNSVILIPISEELIFRKIMLNFYTPKNIFLGMFISSFLFSLIHFKLNNFRIEPLLIFFFFGFLSSIVYQKFGLLYSIFFHSFFNLIWFLTKNNFIDYWSILRVLDFGIVYWGMFFISMLFIGYFIFTFINRLEKGNDNGYSTGTS